MCGAVLTGGVGAVELVSGRAEQGAWVVLTGRCGCPRWVGGGGYSRGGVDLGIGSDEYFDRTGCLGWVKWTPEARQFNG